MRVNWCTQAERADHGVIVHMNVAGELRAILENDAVAEDAIVGDVRIGHDEIVAADAGDIAALVRAAVRRWKIRGIRWSRRLRATHARRGRSGPGDRRRPTQKE